MTPIEPGRAFVGLGLAASAAALLLYIIAARRKSSTRFARLLYAVAALAGIAVFGRLMQLVATKQFAYRYVFDYVSADLDGPFLYSATWAGQEGSFALWALFTAIIGIVVARRARDWEPHVMALYTLNLLVLFAIMQWLSPFVIVPRETGPRPEGVPESMPWPPPWPPTDGNGLNPSLQNIWMAIHPPIIFFGFATLAVPFCYALAALMKRAYQEWIVPAGPYALLATAGLGAGLFLGGYWAYETQGWHGFWAWDPVENASLFPWLAVLGLVHGMVVQRQRRSMVRTNILLATAAWLLFLYGTFLTRSGVLANFSVHAFSMLEHGALGLLIGLIVAQLLLSLGLVIWRWKELAGAPASERPLTRDTALWFAIMVMIVSSAAVAIGTSWPLISRWPWLHAVPFLKSVTSPEGVRVEPLFYNRLGTVLALPSLFVLGAVPFLAWGRTDTDLFLRRMMLPWLLAIGFGGLSLWFVLHELASGFQADTPRVVTVALVTLGSFAALGNLALAWKLVRKARIAMGGWLTHIGVGMLLAGTVLTNAYEKTETYNVVEGLHPVKTEFGYTLEFAGWTHDGKSDEEVLRDWRRHDHAVLLRVTPTSGKGFSGYTARVAVFKYWNASQGEWATMTWPDIRKQLHRDIYLAAADDPRLLRPMATLRPGETSPVAIPGLGSTGYEVRYDRFFGPGHGTGMVGIMGAEMTLFTTEGKQIRIRPALEFREGEPRHVNVEIPEVNGAAIIDGGIRPDTKELTVAFELPEAPARWVVPIAATNKPMINLVWLGVLLIVGGTLISMVRRLREDRAPVSDRLERPA